MAKYAEKIWLLVVVVTLTLSVTGCDYERKRQAYADMAESRVRIGDEREKVSRAFSDAWHYAPCITERGGWDFFLYEGHTPSTVIIVAVGYTKSNGRYFVDAIGVLDRYELPSLYFCIPEDIFERGVAH